MNTVHISVDNFYVRIDRSRRRCYSAKRWETKKVSEASLERLSRWVNARPNEVVFSKFATYMQVKLPDEWTTEFSWRDQEADIWLTVRKVGNSWVWSAWDAVDEDSCFGTEFFQDRDSAMKAAMSFYRRWKQHSDATGERSMDLTTNK